MDCIDGEGSRQAAIADASIFGRVAVDNAVVPAAILELHVQKRSEIVWVGDAERVAGLQAHSETGRIDGDVDALLDSLPQEGLEVRV